MHSPMICEFLLFELFLHQSGYMGWAKIEVGLDHMVFYHFSQFKILCANLKHMIIQRLQSQ